MKPRWKKFEDRKYVSWIKKKVCCLCKNDNPDAHHVYRSANDYSCIPLCRGHHREYHDIEREKFERGYKINLDWEIINLLSEYIQENKL
jgi:hypothetical protein